MLSPEVTAAIIALSGVIVSVGISLLVALLTRRYNYHHLFAETVSKNRMEWINVWRENISTFLAIAETIHEYCKKDTPCELCELKKEMLKARAMITTRLNLNEPDHVQMFKAIKQLDYTSENENFILQRERVEYLARKILKPEWERVKNEAQGKARKKEN